MSVKYNEISFYETGEHLLDELVKRIVNAVKPIRLVLFGSAARGTLGPNSDIDLMAVVADGIHRRQSAQNIYKSVRDIGLAKDVVVVTESDVRDYGENPSLVIHQALTEGKEIYHA